MEYVRRKMKNDKRLATVQYTLEEDTAVIYEAMTYAQDFTYWENTHHYCKEDLELEVV